MKNKQQATPGTNKRSMGRYILSILVASFAFCNFIAVYVNNKGLIFFLSVEDGKSHYTNNDVGNWNINGIEAGEKEATLNSMGINMQNRKETPIKFNTAKSADPIYRYSTDIRKKDTLAAAKPQELDNHPLFVLHIGPHKTASSTIQCEMTYYQSVTESVGNFTYLGRQYGECKNKSTILKYNSSNVNTRDLVRCLDDHSSLSPCNTRKEWRNFENTLGKLSRVGQNVLLSDEAFSRMKLNNNSSNLELLFRTVRKHGFRFKVVLVYRHYFSWLLSQYNEHYKPLPSRSKYQIWPSNEGGKYIKPFIEYYADNHNRTSTVSEVGSRNYQSAAYGLDLHPVAYLKQQWTNDQIPFAPKESDILVLDMQNNDNNYGIVLNFVRLALSKEVAKELNHHKQRHANDTIPSRENPSMNLDFDMLAVKARELGLFPDHDLFTRRRIALYAERIFQNLTIIDEKTPRICLDELTQIQEFLNQSLFLERTVFPDRSNSQQQHRKDFAKANSRNKFCNLDIEALLAQESVKGIFQRLERIAQSIPVAQDTEEM